MNQEPVVIPRWAWISLVLLALFGLGWFISPRDPSNRPILLLPDAKAVEDYRVSTASWHNRMKTLDSQIATLLSGKFGDDLFSKSREAQKVMDAAIQLAKEIDRQEAPTAATPAKSLLIQAASDYLDATQAMVQWVTAPNEDNLSKSQQALAQARESLEELEQSEWISP
jgi:hypothetical protein